MGVILHLNWVMNFIVFFWGAEKEMKEDGKVATGNGPPLLLDIEDFKVKTESGFY